MSITTEYQHAWQGFFNRTLKNAGLNYEGYGKNYTINIKNDMVIVKFYTQMTVNFYLKVIKIGAQMAPGWIENIKG
jgi:uncharacterized protein YdgA (DUF945 family)